MVIVLSITTEHYGGMAFGGIRLLLPTMLGSSTLGGALSLLLLSGLYTRSLNVLWQNLGSMWHIYRFVLNSIYFLD